jgi:hypothetical protein
VGVVGELVQDGGVNSGEVAEPLLDPRGGINAGGNASFWHTKRRLGVRYSQSLLSARWSTSLPEKEPN